MQTIGIDVGGSSIKVAIMGPSGGPWTAQSRPYDRPTAEVLRAALRETLQGRVTEPPAVGICVPGLLDEPGRQVTLSVNVPGLVGMPLDSLVQHAIGQAPVRLRVINDAIAAGVHLTQAKQLAGRVLVLALGTGVGAAVLDGGHPLAVEGQSPGHIGQMDVSIDAAPPVGPDGGAGSLEAYLGVPALVRAYGSMESCFASARVGDPSMAALVRAVRICHAIYRPNHIALVGGVGIRLKRLLPDLQQAIATRLTNIARPGWTLSTGDHDFHAALGAALLARE